MIFEVADLTFQYHPDDARPALSDINVKIPAGTVTAVLGMSGSGKSTLLSLLGRLIDTPPTRGRVTYYPLPDDLERRVEYAGLPHHSSELLRRKCFGFVLQSAYLLPNLRCDWNVEMPLCLLGHSPAERRRRREELIESLSAGGESSPQIDEIRVKMKAYPATLSGGERQRMALLRALVHKPRVVFADEPWASLDPFWTDRIKELFRLWMRSPSAGDGNDPPVQHTVILVSHNLHDAWDLASQFLLLRDGRLVDGKPLDKSDLPGGVEEIKTKILPRGDQPSPHDARGDCAWGPRE